ncbi:MAG: hypothetical protein N2490_04345 [Ignavibacteria bacterium]|nr:hypothetical protein [Ignavibacteria bacterium]
MTINKFKIFFYIFFIIIPIITFPTFGQQNDIKKFELKEKVLNNKRSEVKFSIEKENEKSPSVSALLSLILPGAGHLYAGRMDIGKYFLTAEAALWLGIVGINIYGNAVRDDSRSFAVVHSGINKNGKDDDFFVNIGLFNNIYEYNNYRLSRGEYDKIYDINSHYWNWDLVGNRELYDEQRKKSERIYNSDRIISAGLIINRIASAISAFLLTNKDIKVSSEFNNFINGSPTGFEIKITKSF